MSVLVYLLIWYFKAQTQIGVDETRYINSLILFQEGNYKVLFQEGCSIPYLLLNVFWHHIFEDNLLALRFSSMLSGLLILSISAFLMFRVFKVKKVIGIVCLIYILNLFALRPDIFFGINEYLRDFFGCLIIFIILSKPTLRYKHYITIGALFGLAILTRPMAASFLLVFLITIYVLKILRNKIFLIIDADLWKKYFLVLFTCLSIIVLFNCFNLIKYGHFSWEDKDLPGEITWAQYDYHNVIKNYNGELSRGKHGSVFETKEYLKENGDSSLPHSFLEMIYFDWEITIHEFFMDYYTSLKYLTRLTGLLYLFGLIYFLKRILFNKYHQDQNIIFCLCFSLIFPLAISFVVISNIQPRWFMFFLPLTICSYFIIINKSNNSKKLTFVTLNNILLFVANIPFIYQNFAVLL